MVNTSLLNEYESIYQFFYISNKDVSYNPSRYVCANWSYMCAEKNLRLREKNAIITIVFSHLTIM